MFLSSSLSTCQSGRKHNLHIPILFLLFLTYCSFALTRWSSVQFVPDADLLGGGAVVLSAQGYYFGDVDEGTAIIPSGSLTFGLTEWVNFEAGYAGGASLGLKARILGETRNWMPSLAIGTRNIFTHKEAYLFNRTPDSLGSEFYLVAAKSIEKMRFRFHLGALSIPNEDKEKACPFAAVEKYFGMGLYVSLEAYYREKEIHPSIFTSWRVLKKKLEVSAGIFDVTGMFVDKGDVPPNSPFYESSAAKFVRPGIWFGLRYNAGLKIGKAGGFTGIENSLNSHSASIGTLKSEVDSLKLLLKRSNASIETLNRTLMEITDSSRSEQHRYKTLVVEELANLNSLYNAEPFDPEEVNRAMGRIIAGRDNVLPALYEIITDPVKETRTRVLAISALGEIGSQAAADIVIGLLGQSTIPEVTIECLIALGKMKETRAVYLMQQLSNDPNDDVAFTASEILQKLEKETGISAAVLPVTSPAPVSVPEKTIGGEKKEKKITTAKPVAAPIEKPVTKAPVQKKPVLSEEKKDGMNALEKPEIQETTVTREDGEKSSAADKKSQEGNAAIPEATISPQKKKEPEIEIVAPVIPAVAPQQEVKKAAEDEKKTADEKSVKKEKKRSAEKKKKKKRIDTSSDTW